MNHFLSFDIVNFLISLTMVLPIPCVFFYSFVLFLLCLVPIFFLLVHVTAEMNYIAILNSIKTTKFSNLKQNMPFVLPIIRAPVRVCRLDPRRSPNHLLIAHLVYYRRCPRSSCHGVELLIPIPPHP